MADGDSTPRKRVFIPVVPLVYGSECSLLELIIEPAGPGVDPQFHSLKNQGLGTAVAMAKEALRIADLPPLPPLRKRLTVNLANWRPPFLFLTNPSAELSNASGAALGVAMGLLMYDGCCPYDRIIATGQLIPAVSPVGLIRVESTNDLKDKLAAALTLGYQQQTLPFVVPARIRDEAAKRIDCAKLIRALAAYNIHVLPVNTLQEIATGCRMPAIGVSD